MKWNIGQKKLKYQTFIILFPRTKHSLLEHVNVFQMCLHVVFIVWISVVFEIKVKQYRINIPLIGLKQIMVLINPSTNNFNMIDLLAAFINLTKNTCNLSNLFVQVIYTYIYIYQAV